MRARPGVVCILPLVLGACSDPIACPASPFAAVRIAVQDSVAGAPAADGALGTLTNAAGVDTLSQPDTGTLVGGHRSGTFTVQVQRAGYQLWQRAGVRVPATGCGPQTQFLTARLQPAS